MRALKIQLLLLATAGCGGENSTMRVWGDAAFQNQPIESGQIVLFPIDGTPGPSTGGEITAGKYDLSKASGPRAAGKYRVEITGFGKQKSYNPNSNAPGAAVAVREQYIPAKYNRQSELRMEVSNEADKNQHDFQLQ